MRLSQNWYIIYAFVLIVLIVLIFSKIIASCSIDGLQNSNQPNEAVMVISRYQEDLKWLEQEPFNQIPYIVYNKGKNDTYSKTKQFLYEVKLPNVGREAHTYLYHIIENYDQLSNLTIFLPGSADLPNKFERSKQMLNEIIRTNYTHDYFACLRSIPIIRIRDEQFQIDYYESSHALNKESENNDIAQSAIRPFGKWHNHWFQEKNDVPCFTTNSIFALLRTTIRNKPESFYQSMLEEVDKHSNHETVHFLERSWETVFHPLSNPLYLYNE
jgi:hypothetical protein